MTLGHFDFARYAAKVQPIPPDVYAAEERAERRRKAEDHWRKVLPDAFALATGRELVGRVSDRRLLEASTWNASKGNLVLLGRTGGGKSTMAAFAMKAHLVAMSQSWRGGEFDYERAIERVRWVSCRRLGELVRGGFAFAAQLDTLVESAKHATLLVFDDLGQDGAKDAVNSILNDRYEARGAVTIATSGLSEEGLVGQYGQDVVRRLLQAGGKPATVIGGAS